MNTKFKLIRTNSSSADFNALINELDKDLYERYPEIQSQYTGFNKIENIDTVVIAYIDDRAVGCGCFKTYDKESIEIKRMFVHQTQRGKGISKGILAELEIWAKELGFQTAILETGLNQPEAISLYKKSGYVQIENFGTYKNIANSVCFQKIL